MVVCMGMGEGLLLYGYLHRKANGQFVLRVKRWKTRIQNFQTRQSGDAVDPLEFGADSPLCAVAEPRDDRIS